MCQVSHGSHGETKFITTEYSRRISEGFDAVAILTPMVPPANIAGRILEPHYTRRMLLDADDMATRTSTYHLRRLCR